METLIAVPDVSSFDRNREATQLLDSRGGQMAVHPNAQVLREGYEAFSTGDMDTLNRLFADDVVWHEGGRNPLSGEYKGKEQVCVVWEGNGIDTRDGQSRGT